MGGNSEYALVYGLVACVVIAALTASGASVGSLLGEYADPPAAAVERLLALVGPPLIALSLCAFRALAAATAALALGLWIFPRRRPALIDGDGPGRLPLRP